MADILIRGTYFPRNGHRVFRIYADGRVEGEYTGIPLGAAVELPEHGDLIDRDAFDADARKRYCSACDNYNGTKCRACWVDDMLGDVADFEAVIPSNKEGTE